MTQRLLFSVVSLWLCFPFHGATQNVGFALPFYNNITPGTYLTMPVTVSGFDSVISVQFVIDWNPEVLSFVQVLSYNLPGMTDENFNWTQAQDSGILRFAWSTANVTAGVTRPDGAHIFRIVYQVIGQVNESSAQIFTESPPTEFEVIQIGHPVYDDPEDCNLTNGFLAVGYTVPASEPSALSEFPLRVAPNPFSNQSPRAYFYLEKNSDVQATLTDALGRPVWEQRTWLPAGEHGMEIVSDRLPENGIYYLIIRTATGISARPLVKY